MKDLNLPLPFKDFVDEHNTLWTRAQTFDGHFNFIIPNDTPNYRFCLCVTPLGCSIGVEGRFRYDWENLEDIHSLPLEVLQEYTKLRRQLEEWEKAV